MVARNWLEDELAKHRRFLRQWKCSMRTLPRWCDKKLLTHPHPIDTPNIQLHMDQWISSLWIKIGNYFSESYTMDSWYNIHFESSRNGWDTVYPKTSPQTHHPIIKSKPPTPSFSLRNKRHLSLKKGKAGSSKYNIWKFLEKPIKLKERKH